MITIGLWGMLRKNDLAYLDPFEKHMLRCLYLLGPLQHMFQELGSFGKICSEFWTSCEIMFKIWTQWDPCDIFLSELLTN